MKILVIAPHPDDEVLGCGGMIAKRALHGDEVYVCIVTKGSSRMFDPEVVEQGRREAIQAHLYLGVKDTIFLDFPAAQLETVQRAAVIRSFERLVAEIKPDEVYIPHHGDIHHDHKIVNECAMVAIRPKYPHKVQRVYAYEVPSETGWDLPRVENAFVPTVYMEISAQLDMKIAAMSYYQSQSEAYPGARSLKAVRSLAQMRGTTVCVAAAEAFELIRELR